MALRVPLFDVNANGGTYVNGVAYDHETRRGVVDMHARLQANGINPSLRMVARMTGTSHSFVSKIIEWESRGMPVADRPKGGCMHSVMEEWEREYLAFLVLSGSCYNDDDYWWRLVADLGYTGGITAVRSALTEMKATLRKTNKEPIDKYTVVNTIRLAEFVEEIAELLYH